MSSDSADALAIPGVPDPAAEAPAMARAAAEYQAVDFSELEETEIIRRYAPMVKRIATHLKARLPEGIQLDDLIQAGMIAVLRAMRRGSLASMGGGMGASPPFSLNRTISNAMIDEARRETWAPVRTVRLAKAAGRAMRLVKQRLGRDGSDEEIAAEMGVELAEYHTLLVEIAGIRLLDIDDIEKGDGQLSAEDDQHAELDRSRMLSALTAAIAALPEREKTIVSLYYEHELNMDEVGKVLGIDKSTVCRAHGRALLNLRNVLGDWAAAERQPRSRPGA
jgi:RNA polymerase sigma factor for flagellar operon FliA